MKQSSGLFFYQKLEICKKKHIIFEENYLTFKRSSTSSQADNKFEWRLKKILTAIIFNE